MIIDGGAEAPGGTDVSNEPDDGFTADERAAFESMRSEEPAPEPEGGDVGDGGDGAGAGDAGGDEAAAAAAAGGAKPGVAGSGDGVGDEDEEDEAPVAGEAAGAPKPPRRVPYKKFKRAEDDAKSAREEAQQARELLARFEERMAIVSEAINAAGNPQAEKNAEDDDPEPDPETEIFAHNAWLSRQLKKTHERLESFTAGQQQTQQQSAVLSAYEEDAASFVRTEPAFAPAYQFLMNSRITELALYYFDKDLTQEGATLTREELGRIKQAVQFEERQLAETALKQGKSPAARIFAMARMRGYRAAAPAAGNGNGAAKPNGKGNGQAPGSLATETVTEELARVRRGVEASTSLSQGGGAPPPARLTAKDLAELPQDQFNEMVESLSPQEWARLMGGNPG